MTKILWAGYRWTPVNLNLRQYIPLSGYTGFSSDRNLSIDKTNQPTRFLIWKVPIFPDSDLALKYIGQINSQRCTENHLENPR